MNIIRQIKNIIWKLGVKLRLISIPRRYQHLFKIIDRSKCRRIMEVGTWDGENAKLMIETAKKHWPPQEIEYYGFDLFEDMDEKTMDLEMAKKPPPLEEVKQKLQATGARIFLFKGNTRFILPQVTRGLPLMDFIFIDGGHSLETVQNDWYFASQLMHEKTVVIFDDYWNIKNSGCNQVVDTLDRNKYQIKILKPTDKFKKDWGTLKINLVQVSKRQNKIRKLE